MTYSFEHRAWKKILRNLLGVKKMMEEMKKNGGEEFYTMEDELCKLRGYGNKRREQMTGMLLLVLFFLVLGMCMWC